MRAEILDELRETMALRNGAVLASYPCRSSAVRGLRAQVVVCDEVCFFRSSDYGSYPDLTDG